MSRVGKGKVGVAGVGHGWNKVGGLGAVGFTSSDLQINCSTNGMFLEIVRETFATLI